jgi:DNA-binding NarL/FixJ family response regulator
MPSNGVATVMVYSDGDEPELMLRSLRSGVREFLTLPFPPSTMAEALVRAAARRPPVFLSAQLGEGRPAPGRALPIFECKL